MPATDPLLEERAARIRLLALDVDGVLTDGKIYFDSAGNESKAFYSRDGLGLKALQQAGERYRKGIIDYLPVLTQLSMVQRLERDLLSRRLEQLVARVNLYRALGGGIPENLVERVVESNNESNR